MTQTEDAPLVLLAEDSEPDSQLTSLVLRRTGVPHQLEIVRDGEACLDYLRDLPADQCPDLILLDLSMPKLDGRGVLRALKQDEVLRQIPVVILSTSNAAKDIRDSLRLHANAYVVKPIGLDRFVGVLTRTVEFWLQTASRSPSRRL